MARRLNRFTERAFAMTADTTATLVTDSGVYIEDVDGIFDNAVIDQELLKRGKAQGSGRALKRRQPIFTLPVSYCRGVNKRWRVIIDGKSYHVAEDYPDGKGFMTLWLADEPQPMSEAEVVSDGAVWR